MYCWQVGCSESERKDLLEARRDEILDEIEAGQDAAVQETLLAEWLELVKERDQLLRSEVYRENEMAKTECILDLRRVLRDLGSLPFTTEEVNLKQSLGQLYQQVTTFCRENNIEETPKKVEEASMPPPPPPPPPPAPPLPPSTLSNNAVKRRSLDGETPDGGAIAGTPARKRVCPSTPYLAHQTPFRHDTPLQNFNHALMSTISGGLVKRQLKRTSCARSPGGTPARQPRRLKSSDPADILALALQAKFRNVVQASPLSPLPDCAASPDNFGSPVLRPISTQTASEPHSPVSKDLIENMPPADLVETI